MLYARVGDFVVDYVVGRVDGKYDSDIGIHVKASNMYKIKQNMYI